MLRVLRVMLVLLVLDRAGPRVVLRMMGGRWQALGWVGVMLGGGAKSAMSRGQQQYAKSKKRRSEKRRTSGQGRSGGDAGGDAGRCELRSAPAICEGQGAKRLAGRQAMSYRTGRAG